MYKSHGKEYLENNFSSEELESLMKPPSFNLQAKNAQLTKKAELAHNLVFPISPPSTSDLHVVPISKNEESLKEKDTKSLNKAVKKDNTEISYDANKSRFCTVHIQRKNINEECEENETESSNGYPCDQCGKILMHKQSYVSHKRVIHGDYYGGNDWRGSSVVDMVLGQKKELLKTIETHTNFNFCRNNDFSKSANEDHLRTKRIRLEGKKNF